MIKIKKKKKRERDFKFDKVVVIIKNGEVVEEYHKIPF